MGTVFTVVVGLAAAAFLVLVVFGGLFNMGQGMSREATENGDNALARALGPIIAIAIGAVILWVLIA